jgi:hypothetical protein
MNIKSEIDPELMKRLDSLQEMPIRDPLKEKNGLAAFLQEAHEFSGTVTAQPNGRHNRWMHALQAIFVVHRKEQSPMFSTFTTILLIASLILGGGGATVVAAQSSQPDQPLYSLKVMSEDTRINLSASPQSEYQLALEFANRRAEEIKTMLQTGSLPPESVQIRYQSQIEQAIQFALNLPDNQALKALDQIQTRLQTQQQTFLQVQANGSPHADAILNQTRQMLQVRLQWVEAGLTSPTILREQLRLMDQQRKQNRQGSSTPGGQATLVSPLNGSGNPWTTGTPTPGSGYGPGKGSGDCETCTPASGNSGNNPWTTGTPTPGSGYGPGPGPDPTRTCTPGSSTGPGPQPTQQQKNQPTQVEPQPTQQQKNQPTQADPQPTQQQINQPTQAGPQATPESQSTSPGPGPQPTSAPGGPGGKH